MTKRLYEEMKAVLLLWVAYQENITFEAYATAMDATYAVLEKLK